MNRRRFLQLSAGTGIGAGAGCLHSEEGHLTLQRLTLVNALDEPVTTELRIERADTDDVVYEDAYDLPAGLSGIGVDCAWPDEPLLVMTRRADDSPNGETEVSNDGWNSYDTTGEDGCVQILSETHERGTSFFSHRTECPIRSPTCHTDVKE